MKKPPHCLIIATAVVSLTTPVWARSRYEQAPPPPATVASFPACGSVNHDVGKVGLGITNYGVLGNFSRTYLDCFTGKPLYTCEYPIGSNTRYLWGGALWIGAIVGTDTLVSTGADGWALLGNEFHPDFAENGGDMIYRSTVDPNSPAYPGAHSEQDYIAVYRDTCTHCSGVGNDPLDQRPHRPLNIEVTQRSFAWSYPVAEDFILFDFSIKNIGNVPLENMFMGMYMDHDIHDMANQYGDGALDDLVGMRSVSYSASNGSGCEAALEIEMPWTADNDGDFNRAPYRPAPHVAGTRLLKAGGVSSPTTFNWWVSNGDPAVDFGPMRRINYRDFTTGGMGTPEGDRNKYFYLSNGDQDYDQVRIGAIGASDSIWAPPPDPPVRWFGLGVDVRYLISGGGVRLEPGESVPFTLAYVCGENLHTDPANFSNLPYDPDAFLAGLNFNDYLTNGVWAGWVYDNPGVDTDNDGYAGRYQLCGDDTLWFEGDGVPDWSAASLPVAPAAWVEPRDHALLVRWNGYRCENLVDWASREKTFEGYRVYLSTTGAVGSFAAVGSYDVEDYCRYIWDFNLSSWTRCAGRLTLEEARCRYAPAGCSDPTWHPLDYTRQAPYVMPGYPDSLFYFVPLMDNSSRFGIETPFIKRFPDAPCPAYESPAQVPVDSADFYLTDDGFFKYYEYEMLIEALAPRRPYWVAVTSSNYGSKLARAEAAESSITGNDIKQWAGGACCDGIVGNIDCDAEGMVSLADVVRLIDYLYISKEPLCCLEEADVNQSGGVNPTVDDLSIVDVSMLIDYLFLTGPSLGLPTCP